MDPEKIIFVRQVQRRLAERIAGLSGVVESESMFGRGDAFWVNGKEVAHFDTDDLVEVRLTKAIIREQRAALKADPRVVLRPSGADWITVRFASERDIAFVVDLVAAAAAAHRPPPGVATRPAPTGGDLERRRRFH